MVSPGVASAEAAAADVTGAGVARVSGGGVEFGGTDVVGAEVARVAVGDAEAGGTDIAGSGVARGEVGGAEFGGAEFGGTDVVSAGVADARLGAARVVVPAAVVDPEFAGTAGAEVAAGPADAFTSATCRGDVVGATARGCSAGRERSSRRWAAGFGGTTVANAVTAAARRDGGGDVVRAPDGAPLAAAALGRRGEVG